MHSITISSTSMVATLSNAVKLNMVHDQVSVSSLVSVVKQAVPSAQCLASRTPGPVANPVQSLAKRPCFLLASSVDHISLTKQLHPRANTISQCILKPAMDAENSSPAWQAVFSSWWAHASRSTRSHLWSRYQGSTEWALAQLQHCMGSG